MRLIDADLLKENIIKCLKPLEPEEMIDVDVALLSTLMEINKQPTAFGTDEVVEQLDNEADRSYADFREYADEIGKSEDDDWHYMGLRRVIEIVKSVADRRYLERQIPKKPIIYPGTNRADCPVCMKTVRGIGKPFGKYCAGCGQRLKWEAED